jgi:methionine biosynthesis protein MetW
VTDDALRRGQAERAAPVHYEIRGDLKLIADMIAPGSRVLDVGCGDGALLTYLVKNFDVDGRGIELSQAGVNATVAQGLSVVQGDADTDLTDYPTQAFDYVVLSQTLQATRNPKQVVSDLVRIGAKAIVSFPNFGYWQVRWKLLLGGRMPRTGILGEDWHQTQNIHLCTILDFIDLCQDLGIVIERRISVNPQGRDTGFLNSGWAANLLGEQAVFLLSSKNS